MKKTAVFTSVDGIELDREAVARLRASGVDIVPVSERTLVEVAPLAQQLGFDRAMIVEAGAAIARRRGERWDVEPCGPPAEVLLDIIRDIEDRCGATLLVDSYLDDEVRFGERFVIESGDFDAVARIADELGFTIRRGRHFLHLCLPCDHGEAFTQVRDELGCEKTIGVGSIAADAELLNRMDIAIVMPGDGGIVDADLIAKVPHARVARHGWAAAVEKAALPRVSPVHRMGEEVRAR